MKGVADVFIVIYDLKILDLSDSNTAIRSFIASKRDFRTGKTLLSKNGGQLRLFYANNASGGREQSKRGKYYK